MHNFDAVSNAIAFLSPWFQAAALYLKSNLLQFKRCEPQMIALCLCLSTFDPFQSVHSNGKKFEILCAVRVNVRYKYLG